MRIALSVWQERISPVFDSARCIRLVDLEEREETARSEVELPPGSLPERVNTLIGYGVDTVLCGAISRPFEAMLSAAGVTVVPFLAGEAEDVLDAFRSGAIGDARFRMPGCCGRGPGRGRRRRRGGCGRGRYYE